MKERNNNSGNNFLPSDYWETRLQKSFDLEGVGFSGLGKAYNKWMYKVRRGVFSDIIKNLPCDWRTCNVLDIGSGTGFYINRWEELHVRSITGIDITEVAIQKLRELYPKHEFYQLDIGDRNCEVKSNCFEVVSAFDVLYHIIDDDRYKQAIVNIHTSLKPKGYFIFFENFIHKGEIRKRHYVFRNIKDIERMISDTGFEIICRQPIFIFMNAPVDSNHQIFKKLWSFFSKLISRSNIMGYMSGALLYPVESLLVRVIKESPSTEVMICK